MRKRAKNIGVLAFSEKKTKTQERVKFSENKGKNTGVFAFSEKKKKTT